MALASFQRENGVHTIEEHTSARPQRRTHPHEEEQPADTITFLDDKKHGASTTAEVARTRALIKTLEPRTLINPNSEYM